MTYDSLGQRAATYLGVACAFSGFLCVLVGIGFSYYGWDADTSPVLEALGVEQNYLFRAVLVAVGVFVLIPAGVEFTKRYGRDVFETDEDDGAGYTK